MKAGKGTGYREIPLQGLGEQQGPLGRIWVEPGRGGKLEENENREKVWRASGGQSQEARRG